MIINVQFINIVYIHKMIIVSNVKMVFISIEEIKHVMNIILVRNLMIVNIHVNLQKNAVNVKIISI